MKISIENKRVCIRHWNDHELIRINLSPEEAVKFATELINKAYPLTAAVQRRTRQAKLAEPINKAIETVQQTFRSSFNQGCHRR